MRPGTAYPNIGGNCGNWQRTAPETKPSFRNRTLSLSMALEAVQVSRWRSLSRTALEAGVRQVICGSGPNGPLSAPSPMLSLGLHDSDIPYLTLGIFAQIIRYGGANPAGSG